MITGKEPPKDIENLFAQPVVKEIGKAKVKVNFFPVGIDSLHKLQQLEKFMSKLEKSKESEDEEEEINPEMFKLMKEVIAENSNLLPEHLDRFDIATLMETFEAFGDANEVGDQLEKLNSKDRNVRALIEAKKKAIQQKKEKMMNDGDGTVEQSEKQSDEQEGSGNGETSVAIGNISGGQS